MRPSVSRFNPKQLKTLTIEWYEKLKKEGFDDIEDTRNDERRLRSWHSLKYQDIDPLVAQSIRGYYEKAKLLLLRHAFYNEHQERVWALHAEGMTEIEIAKRVPYKKSMVHYIIGNLAKIAKAIDLEEDDDADRD